MEENNYELKFFKTKFGRTIIILWSIIVSFLILGRLVNMGRKHSLWIPPSTVEVTPTMSITPFPTMVIPTMDFNFFGATNSFK